MQADCKNEALEGKWGGQAEAVLIQGPFSAVTCPRQGPQSLHISVFFDDICIDNLINNTSDLLCLG